MTLLPVSLGVRDDVLGVFGDPNVTGKSVLDDLHEGKPTVMMALARAAADRTQTARLRELFGNASLDAAGAAELRGIIEATGAREKIERMIQERAEAALRVLSDAPAAHKALADLAARAVDRAI